MPPPDARRAVVYVSPLPPPAGGIATWTRILVGRGLPRGYVPRVVDTSPGPSREVFQRGSLAFELRRAARVIAEMWRALGAERPAFVHVNVDAMALGFYRDALCAWLARRRGVPVAIHYRGLVAQLADRPGMRLRKRVVRGVARSADLNLVLERRSLAYLRELVGGRSRVEQVPNYYDDRALPAHEPAPRAPGEPLRVVFAGAVTRAKGIPEIVETAARLPAAEFHLLGRVYPESGEILDAAPPNVRVHGEVQHETVLREMARSHVLLFPTRHGEGFPNVVCEALALGLAVVATPVAAIPDMVEDGRGGFLVEPEPAALVSALERLERDDELRVAMGRFNRDKARRLYAYDAVVARLVALYEECGAAGAGPRAGAVTPPGPRGAG
jgi:glycosyltransferase involved in cell wall biosynthesis